MNLIELIIGIGISIVLIYIIFPKYKTEKYIIDIFAKQLVSDIRYIRTTNMNGDLSVHIEQLPNSNPPKYVVKRDSTIIKSVNLPNKSKLICPTNIIKFKSDGTLNAKGETIAILLDDIKVEITIVPFSGRVLLKEGKYAS